MRLNPYTVFWNKHEGQDGIVVLNGPSLKKVPLRELDPPTFGSNQIYKKFIPTYYVNTGGQHFNQESLVIELMNMMDDDRCQAAFINRLSIHVFRHSKAYSVLSTKYYPGYPKEAQYGFSMVPLATIGIKGSVLYPILQIAYYMGFKRLNLVGFDYHYEEGNEHFYPEDPRLERAPGPLYDYDSDKWREMNDVILTACREIYEEDGREIVNWTPESYCDIFRKEDPPWLD
jgi:hypothetical protein